MAWDGGRWTKASGPAYQRALAALGSRDRWRVQSPPNRIVNGLLTSGPPMLERWDGSRLRTLATLPTPAGVDVGPGVSWGTRALSGSGDADVWVVGGARPPGPDTGAYRPYAAHWNGRKMVETPLPAPPSPYARLTGVLAESPTRAWAVGMYQTALNSDPGMGWMLRWDGSAWHRVTLPPGVRYLDGLVRSGGTLYAYGGGLLRLTGSGWERIKVPSADKDLLVAVGDGRGGVWLAFNRILHYPAAGRWSTYRLPHGGNFTDVEAMDRVPGTGALWAVAAVGHLIPESDGDHSFSPLVLRFTGS